MRKLFLILAAALLLAPAAALAQGATTKTYFEGERITGVSASEIFEVVLVKSDRTKAVVEVMDDIEQYVRISRDGSGLVSVGRREMSYREEKEFNRLQREPGFVMRMTLYLPSISDIRLSSSARLRSTDSFSGGDLDILASSSGRIVGDFRVSSSRVKVQCGSSARIDNLILDATTNLAVVASSSARVTITATDLDYSKLGVSSSATVNLSGTGGSGQWSASSSGRIAAADFAAGDLSVNASSSGRIAARVDGAGTGDIEATSTSSGGVTVTAERVRMSNLSATSGATVNISGSGENGKWSATSGGRIAAEEFALKDLTVEATSGSSVRANVSGTLTTRASSGASVRYTGNPARVNNLSSDVKPL